MLPVHRVVGEHLLVVAADALVATVAVKEQAGTRFAIADGHIQLPNDESGFSLLFHFGGRVSSSKLATGPAACPQAVRLMVANNQRLPLVWLRTA